MESSHRPAAGRYTAACLLQRAGNGKFAALGSPSELQRRAEVFSTLEQHVSSCHGKHSYCYCAIFPPHPPAGGHLLETYVINGVNIYVSPSLCVSLPRSLLLSLTDSLSLPPPTSSTSSTPPPFPSLSFPLSFCFSLPPLYPPPPLQWM